MLLDNASAPPSEAPPSGASASGPTAPFVLAAGPYAAGRLRVLSFHGREVVSRSFRFDVMVAVAGADAPDLASTLLGQPAALTLDVPGGDPRTLRGIVSAVEAQAAFDQGRHAFRLRVVPRLWLLGKRKTSRVFQDLSVPQIIAAVLDDAGVPCRAALVEKHPARIYCVQYQETDLAFVTRLCAEEGIFYVFEHAAEETVVFGDGAHAYQPIAGDAELAYRYEHGAGGLVPREHHVARFELRRALKTGTVLHRDHDFRRPLLDLRAETRPSSSAPPPATGDDVLALEAQKLHAYDHHGEDERPDVDAGTADVRLEQRRRRAALAEGASACRRLSPGLSFDLVDHGIDALNGGYVVARVEHEGRAPEAARGREPVYENRFMCVPASVTLRPKRPRRVLQQVVETAAVVGPANEEIYTDEHGRVKVQFPWDLEGKNDEHSSCWVRVAQAWAGAGWGFQFIPRIGMEVVVTFVGGDVDRPLITGCVPNAINVPPFLLPAQKTRSGIRTRTTPKGEGGNELSFEDRKDAEEIRLHARRDLHETVGNDHTTVVTANRDATTGGHQRESVGGNRAVHVGGDQTASVAGDRRDQTAGNVTEVVGANKRVTVTGELSTSVAGRMLSSLGGDGSIQVNGSLLASAGAEDKPSAIGLFAHGSQRLGAKESIELFSEGKIVLQSGKSRIELTPDRITLEAKELVLMGGTSTSLFGSGLQGPALHLTDDAEIVAPKLRLHAKHASIALEENADVRGKLVRLNCNEDDRAASAAKGAPADETKPFSTKLHDANFNPYSGKKYRLVAAGKACEGTTTTDGAVEQQVPKDAQAVQVTVWIDEWPTGRRLSWTIGIVDAVPPAGSLSGAMERLRNLGYEPGVDEKTVDGPTRKALVAFQRDHDLKQSGELDAPTAAKLEQRHGH